MNTRVDDLSDDYATRSPNNLDALWMPFTANRQFKAQPRLLVSAEGVRAGRSASV